MSKKSKKTKTIQARKQERVARLLHFGTQFHVARQIQLAEDSYRKVLDLDPTNFRALYLIAILFSEADKTKEAIEFMKMCLQVNPNYSLAYNDMGVIYQQMGDVAKATECYEKALELNKDFYEAQNNLGVAMQARGNADKAREHYKQALKTNNYYFDAFNNLIFAMDLATDSTVESLIQLRKDWSETHETPLLSKHKPHTNKLTKDRKIRVGYVSADFRLHSASFCFGIMITNFDRDKFEVYAYNNSHTAPDIRTKEFQDSVTVWREVYGKSDDDLAAIIRKDEIDILVDLSGYSAGSRLLTFARKPAPVQACGWGYATSTGLKSIDYFLADEVIVPPEERDLYVEKVAYMPNVINYYKQGALPEVRHTPALRHKIITFGSFNRLTKVSDECFELWAEVMKAVPNSRMLHKINEADPNTAKDRIVRIMKSHGIEPTRLFFAGKTSLAKHLNTFDDVDISLDSFPHTGGLTTTDSLMKGVPVISLKWPTIVGRLSASMLHSVGLDDWIAETKEDYIRIAVEKCADVQALDDLRMTMRDRFNTSPLGDSVGYCREVEKLYLKFWSDYVESKPS
jgi:predicted O-linked N-acetylglucosamine transferase (SPINDLY family)